MYAQGMDRFVDEDSMESMGRFNGKLQDRVLPEPGWLALASSQKISARSSKQQNIWFDNWPSRKPC
jgi:hypothetical protein